METDSSQNIEPPNRAAKDPTCLLKFLKLFSSARPLKRSSAGRQPYHFPSLRLVRPATGGSAGADNPSVLSERFQASWNDINFTLIMEISVNLKFEIRNLFKHSGFVILNLFGISCAGFRVFIIDYVV
jgi:hypothetical protein